MSVIFAAFGADKALLEEFLAFQAHQSRQQDEYHSDVSEAAPDHCAQAPPLGAHPTTYTLETMTSVAGACSGTRLLHLADLLTYPTGPRTAIRPAHLVLNNAQTLQYCHRAHAWPILGLYAPPFDSTVFVTVCPSAYIPHSLPLLATPPRLLGEHLPPPERRPEPATPAVPAIPVIFASSVALQDEVVNISSSDLPEPGSSDPTDGANVDTTPNTAGLHVVRTCRTKVNIAAAPPPSKPHKQKRRILYPVNWSALHRLIHFLFGSLTFELLATVIQATNDT
ncbi:hypothetical protein FRC08_013782 [Ceratobasidium sp. 394]|nr:hypothetical protein FRC08_013782 [Ceratobasidium sp. 394]